MQSKPKHEDISPEEAFASLGMATHLNEQMLMKNNPQATEDTGQENSSQDSEAPPGQEEQSDSVDDTRLQEVESRIMGEISSLREELKKQGNGKQEMADFKKQIEELLASTE